MSDYDIKGLKAKSVCWACVGEPYLRRQILEHGKKRKCSYCGRKDYGCWHVEELSEQIDGAFTRHYHRTSIEADDWVPQGFRTQKGQPVIDEIGGAAVIEEEIAIDVQKILEDKHYDKEKAEMGLEGPFDADSWYAPIGVDTRFWHEEWEYFQSSLRTQARFFSQDATDVLSSVFDGLDKIRTLDERSVIVRAGPDTAFDSFFRARVFQAEEALKEALCRPDLHVGPPPSKYARAGRMNAHGISVFYGANDLDVAIAEVRPPVGSNVVVARFDVIRPLKLLDLRVMDEVGWTGSLFDKSYIDRLERAAFLNTLSSRITRPVMPDDEPLGYLATQAVADFLATTATPTVDGIIFRSVQAPGDAFNVVLFHHASLVELLDIPIETEIKASVGFPGDDGWETYYSVVESVPPGTPPPETKQPPRQRRSLEEMLSEPMQIGEEAWREPSLRVVPDSVQVCAVRRVVVEKEAFSVARRRSEKPKPMPGSAESDF